MGMNNHQQKCLKKHRNSMRHSIDEQGMSKKSIITGDDGLGEGGAWVRWGVGDLRPCSDFWVFERNY